MPVRLKMMQAAESANTEVSYSLAARVTLRGTRPLADTELLAGLFKGAAERRGKLAARLLSEAGSLWELARRSVADLEVLGLTSNEATKLLACLELGRRSVAAPVPRAPVREPVDAYHCVAGTLTALEQERFVVVALDVKNRPRHIATIAEGSIEVCPVDPREVFAVALREHASAIFVAHNHPSGDPTPSANDLSLTERLVELGELLGITVVDHIIVGSGEPSFVSLAQEGKMWSQRVA